jgi:hypothetical protein
MLMISKARKAAQESKRKVESRRQRLERMLEQGLENTIPASDAVAVIEPAPSLPGDGEEKSSRRRRRTRS